MSSFLFSSRQRLEQIQARCSTGQVKTQLGTRVGVLASSLSIGMGVVLGWDGVAFSHMIAQSSTSPTARPANSSGSNFNPNFVSNLQVSKYARAVLEIEQVRMKFQNQAIQVLGKTLPANTCVGNYRANVPPGLENICNGYLQESRAIVDKYGLTPEEFNGITLRSRNDAALMNRIQQELSRWQRQGVANPTSPRPAMNRP